MATVAPILECSFLEWGARDQNVHLGVVLHTLACLSSSLSGKGLLELTEAGQRVRSFTESWRTRPNRNMRACFSLCRRAQKPHFGQMRNVSVGSLVVEWLHSLKHSHLEHYSRSQPVPRLIWKIFLSMRDSTTFTRQNSFFLFRQCRSTLPTPSLHPKICPSTLYLNFPALSRHLTTGSRAGSSISGVPSPLTSCIRSS